MHSESIYIITTEWDYEGNQNEFITTNEKLARDTYQDMALKIYLNQNDNRYISNSTRLALVSYKMNTLLEGEYTHIIQYSYKDIVLAKGKP